MKVWGLRGDLLCLAKDTDLAPNAQGNQPGCSGSGFRAKGAGFRVQRLRFRIDACPVPPTHPQNSERPHVLAKPLNPMTLKKGMGP